GSKLLQERGLDAELLKPLLRETALKAMEFPPVEVQTGPAIRGNEAILALHERMLEQHSEWQSIYRSVSQSIRTMYHPD
ncbi:MAG: DUF2520 domain-containing protein, partial [Marinilabiliales bacterium]|nr:DUF2520 domain-containing protein [Marinilabiliales bacterium]